MGVLRDTLKVLFWERSADDVIGEMLGDGIHRVIPSEKICRDVFTLGYSHVNPAFTEDQARASFRLADSDWMCAPVSPSLKYAASKNVFNVPLRFASDILTTYEDNPVCRFEHLLKWHEITHLLGEDLFTTSYLASYDSARGYRRDYFSWPVVIEHDYAALNHLCSKPMADIHTHLYGAGFSVELNWLSLMNDVSERRARFDDDRFRYSKSPQLQNSISPGRHCSLYTNFIKAAAIRLYLFCRIMFGRCPSLPFSQERLNAVLREQSEIGINGYLEEIASSIDTMKLMFGRRYDTESGAGVFIDYALLRQPASHSANSPDNHNFVLSGERRIMYGIFSLIFNNEDRGGYLSSLLYAYLLIKNTLQNELAQTNGSVGFGNFSDYDIRKAHFLKSGSVYDRLRVHTAVRSSVGSDYCSTPDRYMEARIAPWNDDINAEMIHYNDRNASFICREAVPDRFGASARCGVRKWDYVVHFIKEEEELSENPLQRPRNWNLRNKLKRQSMSLDTLRRYNRDVARRIVGVDAANSEIFCRPEVFAHAFRFLRESHYKPLMQEGNLPKLGVTYHVGEDFYDIVDGLRAVREAVLFLELHTGDRIGHGLVLGTDVAKYYRKRRWKVPMPKQCILDNAAFLLSEARGLDGFSKVEGELEHLFRKYFSAVYGDLFKDREVSYDTYYLSWLLRGDDPELYDGTEHIRESLRASSWGRTDRNEFSPELMDARRNRTALTLNHLYHYSLDVKKNGQKFDQFYFSPELIALVQVFQEKVLSDVERLGISIECNPTSNWKIGDMDTFREHPVSKFYTLPSDDTVNIHQLCVSINTDDKGVFCTSLEREFALIASAFHKDFIYDGTKPSDREVLRWLDEIRNMAFEMRFNKNLHTRP